MSQTEFEPALLLEDYLPDFSFNTQSILNAFIIWFRAVFIMVGAKLCRMAVLKELATPGLRHL